jgi:chemotaxis signal transduction protein
MRSGLSLVLVRMGGRPCAIPSARIVEIVPRVNLDHIPDAPAEVLGVMNLRGRVVPVMDVRAHVAGRDVESRAYQHLVVVELGDRQVGLAVEDVQDVVEVSPSDIEKPGDLTGAKSPGVVRINEELVLVITPEDVIHA